MGTFQIKVGEVVLDSFERKLKVMKGNSLERLGKEEETR